MELNYGKTKIELSLPEQVRAAVLMPKKAQPLENPQKNIVEALRSPISSQPLNKIVKPGETICLVVNDSTRVARTELFLPLIVDELNRAGICDQDISIIFANGSHRPMSEQEMIAQIGEPMALRIRHYNHDSRDENNLVYMGDTKRGTPVFVNKIAAEADRLILTGSVVHHFFAGFGGGRKALVPGVAGWETIRKNHSLLLDPQARSGALQGNPVHEDLLQAAQMLKVDFILNTVLNEDKKIVAAFAGDMVVAHLAACDLVNQLNAVTVDEPADLVIASCGGYPKDINLYQAHKTLDNAMQALKPGGTLILLAECAEGIGSEIFEEWITRYSGFQEMEQALRENFVLGGHKAYTVSRLVKQARVYIMSELDSHPLVKLGFIPVQSVAEALDKVFEALNRPKTVIIPQGSLVLPCLNKGAKNVNGNNSSFT